MHNGETTSIPLLPGKVYMAPSGYKVRMEKHPSAPSWRIIGTAAEGTFCHKPCTVSGGGKSEISKSLVDYIFKWLGSKFLTAEEKQAIGVIARDTSTNAPIPVTDQVVVAKSGKASRVKRIPLGFMGDGRDTASAALYLASDEARFVTGTELVVDGGMTARCD